MESSRFALQKRKIFITELLLVAGMGAFFFVVIASFFVGMACRAEEVKIGRTFYFLVLPADEQTATVWAQNVYVNGGAGYSFLHDGTYYVALASYRTENEANNVRASLKQKGRQTKILPLTVDSFYFTTRAQKEEKQNIEDCVNTLLQCVDLLYNTANGVDTAQYTQEDSRAIVAELKTVLGALREKDTLRTEEILVSAINQCRGIISGTVYAKDIRYLQLFLSEKIYDLQKIYHK